MLLTMKNMYLSLQGSLHLKSALADRCIEDQEKSLARMPRVLATMLK